MTRIQWRPIFGVGFAAAILAYAGCGRTFQTPDRSKASQKTTPTTSAPAPAATAEPAPSSSKLFADWKGLRATIVVTGEMNGYLDPCGCTEGQLGGLGRRSDLLARMKAQGIPAVKIDLGGLTKDPANARGGLVQARVKFNTAIEALEKMAYDAVALAPEDLKLDVLDTLSAYQNQKDRLTILAANVTPSAALAEAFAGVIRPSVVVQDGPFKVGVTAVVDPDWYKALKDPGLDALEVRAPESALPDLLRTLEGQSDIQVLMVQGPPELAKKLGEMLPGFELVISTSPTPDPLDQLTPIVEGKNSMIQVGQQGKYVGVVGLFGEAGKPPTVRYTKLSLLADRLRNAEDMRVLIDETMQRNLKELRVVEDFPRMANAAAPAGATYVGAEACKECHPHAYDKWLGTPHSHAFETLVHNPKDPRRNREFDAECVSCHTTGFTYKTGWVSGDKTPNLKGNQCENCHGPASKHIEEPTNKVFLDAMHRTAEMADKGGLCLKCHDGENSPKFKFDEYYPRIVHKGLDKLTDPKVRQGKPPAQASAAK